MGRMYLQGSVVAVLDKRRPSVTNPTFMQDFSGFCGIDVPCKLPGKRAVRAVVGGPLAAIYLR